MSKISTILDQLKNVTLPGLFSDKKYINNPYELLENTDNILLNGYGFKVESGDIADINTFHQIHTSQKIVVVLTEGAIRLKGDPTILHTITKNMMEDVVALRLLMEDEDQILKPDDIEKIDWAGTTAVQFVSNEKQHVLFVEVTFAIEISENYT